MISTYKKILFMEIMISIMIFHEKNGRNSSNLKKYKRSKSPFLKNKFQ